MTNQKGVAIRYGDVAPEAKENFVAKSSQSLFDTLEQLQRYNVNFPNYSNPCEVYSTVLDGTALPIPSNPETENFGFWSSHVSDAVGNFLEPITLELKSEGYYTSSGLTLTFDTYNNIYPISVNIEWLRVTPESYEVISQKDFTPDSAIYFCENKVERYNRVVMRFPAMNMPYSRVKLRSIDYGRGTIFYGRELRNVGIIQELDPVSTQISINTADFTIDSAGSTSYTFQRKQPLNVYFNGELLATTFVKQATRQSKFLWNIQSEDYIGIMDGVPYHGGIYYGANAIDVLTDIFKVAKVPFVVDDIFADATVTGYIPYTTCREALMQVAFAIQAVVDTSNSDVVKVFALADEVTQTIPLNRIMQGQNFVDEETVTGVEVTAHAYKAISETQTAYDADERGTGQNIFVKFSEPLHDLSISNGEIIKSGTNYAIINADSYCVLSGQKYEHTTQTKRKNDETILSSEIERIVAVDNATLVSSANLDNVLQKCYNWFTRINTTNLKIIEGRHDDGTSDPKVIVGDKITCETEYLGEVTGRIIRQTFGLAGGITVKDSVLK